jgi:hypothetical protein
VIRDSSTPLATYGSFINRSFMPRETVARRSLTQDCQAVPCRWVVDFAGALAFGVIDSVEYSFEVAEGFPTAGPNAHCIDLGCSVLFSVLFSCLGLCCHCRLPQRCDQGVRNRHLWWWWRPKRGYTGLSLLPHGKVE